MNDPLKNNNFFGQRKQHFREIDCWNQQFCGSQFRKISLSQLLEDPSSINKVFHKLKRRQISAKAERSNQKNRIWAIISSTLSALQLFITSREKKILAFRFCSYLIFMSTFHREKVHIMRKFIRYSHNFITNLSLQYLSFGKEE